MEGTGGLNFGELLPLIARLGENPAALNALSGLMGAMNTPKAEPKQSSEQSDPGALLSALLGQRPTGGEAQGAKATGGIFGTGQDMKNRIALLSAVAPFLSEERRGRLETVIKLLRVAELGTLSTLLGP